MGRFNHLRESPSIKSSISLLIDSGISLAICYPEKSSSLEEGKSFGKIIPEKFGGFRIMMYFCTQNQALRVAQLWHTNRVSHRDNHGGKRMCKCLTT